ncbi:MAG: nucleotide pyrophosphohydrolase [Desulfobulbus sp.]|jgi:tetrapyrrole methylase family protein/MazG family protein/ATP diphosphatase|uniref:MazG nucleotide pyrophosphohydrolase domain-containing protein n=1 Tax=Desulfobulbus sp. TaxID=895 RepID=UPI0028464B15|nr:MazG nucleotide pyrophosphohydrolase domain-containing protein [Desulfobulbus sp.]MDR2549345.1 nucleotide pyrophosphohydrolase [Desulfobulbus sp.]
MELPPDHETDSAFARLERLVATLRSPDGCPWDIKQTPLSLKKYLLEECRELAEAIDSGDERAVCEEMGDVYFILAMLAAMFNEQDRFSTGDAIEGIIAKMVRRHPHVFGDTPITDEQALREQWRRIKEQEKRSVKPSPP